MKIRNSLHVKTRDVFAFMTMTAMLSIPNAALSAEIEWKMHALSSANRPEGQAGQRFADLVNEKAGDRLQITYYPGSSLGISDVDLARILPESTTIQAAMVFPSFLSRDLPTLAHVVEPGVVPSKRENVKIAPVIKEIVSEVFQENGMRTLGFVQYPYTTLDLICKEPVNSLADLRSKKIRTWDNFTSSVFESLGVTAVVIRPPDLYVAMSTGVVDCAFYPIGQVQGISLQEVAGYSAYLAPSVLAPINITVSEKAWGRLTPDLQEILKEAAAIVEQEGNDLYLSGAVDKEASDKLVAKGFTVLEPFPETDQEAFRAAANEKWMELTSKSEKAQEYRRRVIDALKQ
jgi:TRAP-type C4-dicarboxylate transport system substrate-binding protein